MAFFERTAFLARQTRHWAKMLTGNSYYHKPQNIGKKFVPDRLEGYFNDMTAKVVWNGQCDSDGVPVSILSDGEKFQHPILLAQKALGHWDGWLLDNQNEDKRQFYIIADWFVANQDEKGGWDMGPFSLQKEFKYSAMAQGQILSVLVRAYNNSVNPVYKTVARKTFALLCLSTENGGVTNYIDGDVLLEEYPCVPLNTILNGWIFALFGIFDYNLVFGDEQSQEFLSRTLNSLVRCLKRFDNGYWSLYDDSLRRLASPFYHNLHLAQLEALCLVSDAPELKVCLRRWQKFERSSWRKLLATAVKGFQKIKEPPSVIIVK